jgi:sucrose-6-phosphate hydrolase SacC (GH32 family)
MRRFAESRRKLAADPYRPLYHFVSPESTLNDPNGLCFWHGQWPSSELPDVTSRAPESAPVWLASDEPLKLRVFIDKSVVEVFVNGRQCVAARVYPGRADSLGVSLRAQGSDAVLKQLDAWTMKSFYAE